MSTYNYEKSSKKKWYLNLKKCFFQKLYLKTSNLKFWKI